MAKYETPIFSNNPLFLTETELNVFNFNLLVLLLWKKANFHP